MAYRETTISILLVRCVYTSAVSRWHQDILELPGGDKVVRCEENVFRIIPSCGHSLHTVVSAGPDGSLIVNTPDTEVTKRPKSAAYAVGRGDACNE